MNPATRDGDIVLGKYNIFILDNATWRECVWIWDQEYEKCAVIAQKQSGDAPGISMIGLSSCFQIHSVFMPGREIRAGILEGQEGCCWPAC